MLLWGRVAIAFDVWWRTYVFAPNRESHKTMGISWDVFGHEIRNLNFWNTNLKLVLITALSHVAINSVKIFEKNRSHWNWKKIWSKKYYHPKSWCGTNVGDVKKMNLTHIGEQYDFIFHKMPMNFVFARIWIGLWAAFFFVFFKWIYTIFRSTSAVSSSSLNDRKNYFKFNALLLLSLWIDLWSVRKTSSFCCESCMC